MCIYRQRKREKKKMLPSPSQNWGTEQQKKAKRKSHSNFLFLIFTQPLQHINNDKYLSNYIEFMLMPLQTVICF